MMNHLGCNLGVVYSKQYSSGFDPFNLQNACGLAQPTVIVEVFFVTAIHSFKSVRRSTRMPLKCLACPSALPVDYLQDMGHDLVANLDTSHHLSPKPPRSVGSRSNGSFFANTFTSTLLCFRFLSTTSCMACRSWAKCNTIAVAPEIACRKPSSWRESMCPYQWDDHNNYTCVQHIQ